MTSKLTVDSCLGILLPLLYHDLYSSKQKIEHSFPMPLPKSSFWNYFSLNPPPPNMIYPVTHALKLHVVQSGIVLSLVEPPIPYTSLTLESSALNLHVVESSVVLSLVEHAVEAEHGGEVHEFLLGRGGQDLVPLCLQVLLFLLRLWLDLGLPDFAYNIKVEQFILSLDCILTGSSSPFNFSSTLGFQKSCLEQFCSKAIKINFLVLRITHLFIFGVLFEGNWWITIIFL